MRAAAFWYARRTDEAPDPEQEIAFARWLAVPANASAFHEIEASHRAIRAVAETEVIHALRRDTLSRVASTRHRHGWRALAACLAILLIGASTLLGVRFSDQIAGIAGVSSLQVTNRSYRTGIGERLSIDLPDGSTVALDSSSRLDVDFSAGTRALHLLAGQAMFDVASDAVRPFVVSAADQTITAHGTSFDVRIGEGKVKVALFEGKVVVKPIAKPEGRGILMRPHEVLLASGDEKSIRRMRSLEEEASWRDGLLIFTDEMLGTAVNEMSRYSGKPLVIGDPALGQLRLSGAFRTDDTDLFLEALTAYFPEIRVVREQDKVVLTASKPQGL